MPRVNTYFIEIELDRDLADEAPEAIDDAARAIAKRLAHLGCKGQVRLHAGDLFLLHRVPFGN